MDSLIVVSFPPRKSVFFLMIIITCCGVNRFSWRLRRISFKTFLTLVLYLILN
ncbi:hypothetical protein Golob_002824 [Gossypium lobatum]|uniref:Uncharacterized protein n=1 Tax=Gossypium lobatum TaxID=34289 RepID=A0A7J8N6L4_9ROSI|nr:hypothetical protein [Gossypium lobatum]